MKAIVTGGAGFIGSHLVDKLIEEGHQVIIIDNLSSGQKNQINAKAKFYLADIRDESIDKIFEIEKPELVFHLAAQMSVPFSVENPKFDLDVNGNGILNLLQASVKHKIKKFVFSSTGGAIYGDAEIIPTTEEEKPVPLAPYGISKFLSENYLNFYKEHFGLNYTVLRYANVYGPRQVNAHESGVITIFVRGVLEDKALKIYAYEDQPDGMIRDYVFVADVVSANIVAINSDSGTYNIGTGVSTKTKDIYDLVCKIANKKVDLSFHPPRPGDIKANTLNNSFAKEKLNWEPKYNLKKGMESTVNYFKEIL